MVLSPSKNPLLFFFFFFSSVSFISSSNSVADSVSDLLSQPSDGTTIHRLLPKYGLPSGLLPDSVKSYSLSDNGDFVLELENPCYIKFENLVYYDRRITGSLTYGGIKNLKGIEVQRLLFWFDVDEIKIDLPPSNFIYFHVGWIIKKLEVGQFHEIHKCGGGLSSACHRAFKTVLKVPAPTRDLPMLVTE